MATVNLPISKAWTKVAEAAAETVLVQAVENTALEVATTTANAAPAASLIGHRLVGPTLAALRSVIGPGYVWVRIAPRAILSEAIVVVSV